MTARPNENDPVDLDPARDPAFEIEELSKTGSELPPKAITPKVEVYPTHADSERARAAREENVERELPQPSSIERETDKSDDRKNESIEGGERDENVEREDDQRGAA